MSNIPPAFNSNSECLQRKCKQQFPQRVHPVTLIQPSVPLPDDGKSSHILYHNTYNQQSMPNHYHVEPNEYKNLYRSEHLSQFADQERFLCNNYVRSNVEEGEQHCKNSDYHPSTLYPMHNTYMNYLLNNCDDASVSHLSNQHSFFAASNLQHSVSGGHQSNSLPFTNMPEKSVPSESDVLLNSFVGNLTPSGYGVYSQFGETANGNNTFSGSGLLNTFEQSKFDLKQPIKKMEKKQTKLLYSDVLNRAISSDKIQPIHTKDNVSVKDKLERNKSKKLERRKSCPCVNNSPEHSPQQNTNLNMEEKELNHKITKPLSKGDSSCSDQDEVTANLHNTPKMKKITKLNSAQKVIKRESTSKETSTTPISSNPVAESSPQRQCDANSTSDKNKSVGKKTNKQSRSVKQEKNCNYTNKKNKLRKKKKYFEFEEYLKNWQEVLKKIGFWFWTLLWDIATMSFHLTIDFLCNMYKASRLKIRQIRSEIEFTKVFKEFFISFDNLWAENSIFPFWRKFPFLKPSHEPMVDAELLNLPRTREEAMEHLLQNNDKDPYSVLYLDVTCTGDQIRRHYKRLAMLVHPDKNDMPQAEEAFKILQRAFDVIGVPEQRSKYDMELARQQNAQTALNQFSDLLTEIQEKLVRASNTIRCTNCNGRHLRVLVDRPSYAARECAQCKIKHSAKEGDIWAETRMMGFRWVYLACMEGSIYDISQWAACQKSALAHLTANSHNVQYRIVLGDRAPKSRTPTAGSSSFQEFIYNLCTSSMNQQSGQENSSRRRSPRQH